MLSALYYTCSINTVRLTNHDVDLYIKWWGGGILMLSAKES